MVYIVASVGCALAPDIASLLILRAVEGFGAGAGSVLGRVIIRDLFDGPQMARMLSLAMAAFITAPIVAPTIGAVILALASWRWIFVFLALYGLVMLVLAGLFLEESLKAHHRRSTSGASSCARSEKYSATPAAAPGRSSSPWSLVRSLSTSPTLRPC